MLCVKAEGVLTTNAKTFMLDLSEESHATLSLSYKPARLGVLLFLLLQI